jgi:purine-cytosine permease-like protein
VCFFCVLLEHHRYLRSSSWNIFWFSYIGFLLPITSLQCLGAAAAVSTFTYSPWAEGYEASNVGGLLLAMLEPVHTFGKFLTVLLSLSVAANVAPTFYSIGFNCQIIVPVLARVPRYLFSLVALAMYAIHVVVRPVLFLTQSPVRAVSFRPQL